MIEALKTFQLAIKKHGHVLPLLEHINVHVNLLCEQTFYQIIIKDNEVFILHDNEEKQSLPEIRGSFHAMNQLLEGKQRLRVLERKGQLSISAPLRTTLLLESIFFLTKAQEDFKQITNF